MSVNDRDHLLYNAAVLTFLWPGGGSGHEVRFFERTPFEVLLVASALNVPFVTLLAGRLCLITFQPLCLARNAACEVTQSAPASFFVFCFFSFSLFLSMQKKTARTLSTIYRNIPLRLLDCLGLLSPVEVIVLPTGCLEVEGGEGCLEAGFLAGWPRDGFRDGGSRKAEGEGILMVSMPS